MPTQLAQRSLPAIASLGVSVPRYDRHRLVPHILHLGVGGFHRAHLAVYTDDVANDGGTWGIRGLGILDRDRRMADVLSEQDHLYTLVERDSDGSRPRVIGSIVDYALAADEPAVFAERMADPDLAIFSLTITEGGYTLANGNATIDAIVDALDARRVAGSGPLTILSCDNLPGNGDVAREAITTIAERRSPELVRYLGDCSFPNSMVDRITPQTTDADRAWVRDELGIDDGWPVVCEPFRQWALEDRFVAGRPDWAEAGVLFTDRVHDWELYKLRMLNAAHSCMAYLAALGGFVYVDEAIRDAAIRGYLERFLAIEAIPTLPAIPGYPAADYAATVLERFANTGVRDQIARLCIDGTSKFPSFLLPTIETQLERGGPIAGGALALAGWARYLATVPGSERAPDPHGDEAAALAREAETDPGAFLQLGIFGERIRTSERFRAAFAQASRQLAEIGPHAAIASISELFGADGTA